MKTKAITIIMILAAGVFSCDDDEKIADPIYEFVSFVGDESVNLGEASNSEDGYPLVVQLWSFDPAPQDVALTLEVTGNNVQKDVDFTVTPSDNVKIKSGKLVSDTIWIKTINNDVGNELERTFDVKISSVGLADVKIGLGISEPKNSSITFKIQDDECSGNPICVYNTALTNAITGDGIDVSKPTTGVVDKINGTVTVTGDLIAYGVFSGAKLTLTLTPDGDGSKSGTATFGEQETGTDSDGYAYKFIEVGSGAYDADTGTISIEYDIYYWSGGWVYWYSVKNVLSIP
jgi:hypothetical protein